MTIFVGLAIIIFHSTCTQVILKCRIFATDRQLNSVLWLKFAINFIQLYTFLHGQGTSCIFILTNSVSEIKFNVVKNCTGKCHHTYVRLGFGSNCFNSRDFGFASGQRWNVIFEIGVIIIYFVLVLNNGWR